MKIFCLILPLFIFINCGVHKTAYMKTLAVSSPTVISNQSNTGNSNSVADENSQTIDDKTTAANDAAQNAGFEKVPDEWKKVNFQKFDYPDKNFKRGIQMDDGEFEFDYSDGDRGMVDFDKVYYLDLTGDQCKDALVVLLEYHCGMGCGASKSYHFYIYSLDKNNTHYIWDYNTNEVGYEGGMKSFVAGNEKIVIEEYGKGTKVEQQQSGSLGYMSKNIDRRTFTFNGINFNLKTKEFIETDYINVFNYQPDIKIVESLN